MPSKIRIAIVNCILGINFLFLEQFLSQEPPSFSLFEAGVSIASYAPVKFGALQIIIWRWLFKIWRRQIFVPGRGIFVSLWFPCVMRRYGLVLLARYYYRRPDYGLFVWASVWTAQWNWVRRAMGKHGNALRKVSTTRGKSLNDYPHSAVSELERGLSHNSRVLSFLVLFGYWKTLSVICASGHE